MAGRHKIYMYFTCRKGWQCQFLEPDLKATAARPITFQDPAKIVEMAERGNALKDLASRQALDYAINMGCGSQMSSTASSRRHASLSCADGPSANRATPRSCPRHTETPL